MNQSGDKVGRWRDVLEAVRADTRLYQELRFPGHRPGWWTWARVLFGSHGLWVLVAYRLDRAHHLWAPAGWPGRSFKVLMHVLISLAFRLCHVLTKSDVVPASGELEPGIYFSDRGHVKMGVRGAGAGTIIHHRVTIGRSMLNREKPLIGRGVWIGPGCVLYGQINVGDGATLLPGTVLTRSVPPRTVLRGNPPVVVARDFDNSALRRTLATDEEAIQAALQLAKGAP